MKADIILKRSFATIGTVCAAWVTLSVAFLMVMVIADKVKTVKHNGDDTLSQMTGVFTNLPFWAFSAVILLAVYAIIYFIRNKQMVSTKWGNFCYSFFQE